MTTINRIEWLKIVTTVMSLIALSGCTQSLSETSTVNAGARIFASALQIFPDGYFVEGYTEVYALTGTDNKGKSYQGSFGVSTGAATIFNGENARPVVTNISYYTFINNLPTLPRQVELILYFSETIPRQFLGTLNSSTGVITIPQDTPTDIPDTLHSEQNDVLGNYLATDSSIESAIGSAIEINASTYELSFVTLVTDGAGNLLVDEMQTFGIDAAGQRLYWRYNAVLPGSNTELNFSGARQ